MCAKLGQKKERKKKKINKYNSLSWFENEDTSP